MNGFRPLLLSFFLAALVIGCAKADGSDRGDPRYPIVDTAQAFCYDATTPIVCPDPGAAIYGQDAQFDGNQPSYTLSADGLTVLDNVTGLTWQKSPDTNGDGTIDSLDKMTFSEAQARPPGRRDPHL